MSRTLVLGSAHDIWFRFSYFFFFVLQSICQAPDCIIGDKTGCYWYSYHNSEISCSEYLRVPHQVCVRVWTSFIFLLHRHGVPIYRIGLKAALVARTACPPLQVQEITFLRFSPFREKVNRLSSWRRTLCRSNAKGLCLNYRYSVFKLQLLSIYLWHKV